MQVLETIKAHPLYIIGALGVVFVGYIYLSSGSTVAAGDGSAADIYAAQNAAGDQLQLAQLQAAAQSASDGASLAGLQIQTQNQLDLANVAAGVALTQINQQGESQDLANTLTANVAMKNIQSGTDQAAITSQTQIQTTQTIAGALVQQANINAGVAEASINAAAAASKRNCGWLGVVLGC